MARKTSTVACIVLDFDGGQPQLGKTVLVVGGGGGGVGIDGVCNVGSFTPQRFQCRCRVGVVERQIVFVYARLLEGSGRILVDKSRPIGHQQLIFLEGENLCAEGGEKVGTGREIGTRKTELRELGKEGRVCQYIVHGFGGKLHRRLAALTVTCSL